jgi:hypothetical protein
MTDIKECECGKEIEVTGQLGDYYVVVPHKCLINVTDDER